MTLPVRIGHYAIERRLGGGGMAEVFLASVQGAEGFAAPVAIKRVLPGFAQQQGYVTMFIAEAKICARLRHPNIVSVLDFNRDEEHGLFLVMELVEGKDLAHLLASGLIPLSLAIYVASEVLRALGHAHNPPRKEGDVRGIVHRDVSPQNVLLSWEGEVKLSDFGIAKPQDGGASVLIKGKPSYMSPEQVDGKVLDGRSDLFAVGVMLWEMLTGQVLFQGDSIKTIWASLLLSKIGSPKKLRPDLPNDVCDVVMKLLRRDPDERYGTAEAALKDLLACGAAPRDGRSELAALIEARFRSPSEARTVIQPPVSQRRQRRVASGWSATRLVLLFLLVMGGATAVSLGVAVLVLPQAPNVPPPQPTLDSLPSPRAASPEQAVVSPAGAAFSAPAATSSALGAAVPPPNPAAVRAATPPRPSPPRVVPPIKRTRGKATPAQEEPKKGIVEVQF